MGLGNVNYPHVFALDENIHAVSGNEDGRSGIGWRNWVPQN